MIGGGMVDDAVAQERPVLHKPKHGVPPEVILVLVLDLFVPQPMAAGKCSM
jgi:hypothetical protein